VIDRIELFKLLAEQRTGDEIVVCGLGASARSWRSVTSDDDPTFYMNTPMGMVSPFCLGLSLAMPHRQIWGIEGDGALAMNLGNLLTLGNERPSNFVHFVIDNRAYESTGGQPLVDASRADFAEIARGCGIENAYSFDDLESFARDAAGILGKQAYTLIVFRIDLPRYSLPPAQRTAMSQPLEMAYKFIRHIEEVEGKQILA
jgi:thiamine pyrophosphate-dependent acetolactate synthase large subunit-like protein